ncbi:hypothetical protein, partial [Serratia ficaria]|uniref:hypothetical protein n=1 Tax=Serratia ficaria TaxID=61651 RepID=UPI0021C9405D
MSYFLIFELLHSTFDSYNAGLITGIFLSAVSQAALSSQKLASIFPPCQDSCRLELKNFRGPETTKMNTYSPERKAALIARMMPPHNQSVVQLA